MQVFFGIMKKQLMEIKSRLFNLIYFNFEKWVNIAHLLGLQNVK